MTKIHNRDPQGAGAPTPIHNSGSMRPTPNVGPHNDPRAGRFRPINIDSR
jgi:hypothetical protein